MKGIDIKRFLIRLWIFLPTIWAVLFALYTYLLYLRHGGYPWGCPDMGNYLPDPKEAGFLVLYAFSVFFLIGFTFLGPISIIPLFYLCIKKYISWSWLVFFICQTIVFFIFLKYDFGSCLAWFWD